MTDQAIDSGEDIGSGAAARPDLPPACTLGPADGAERMRRWERLAAVAEPRARRHANRLEVRYEPGPGVDEELDALAVAEAQCCSFVDWTVARDGDHPVLHVTADPQRPDDVAPIAALFGAA